MSTDNRTQRELIGAEWSARVVIMFVGVPSVGFAILAGFINAHFSVALANEENERVFIASAVLITAFVTGLPFAIEVVRSRAPALAALAQRVWFGLFVFCLFAAWAYSGLDHVAVRHHRNADFLTVIGEEALARGPTVFIVALVELCAALGLALTARTVLELLSPAPLATNEAPKPEPVVGTPSQAAAVEPEVGWQMWFQACVTIAKGGRVSAKDAYAHYESWAGLNNVTGVLPYVTFGRRMSESVTAMGGKALHSNGRFYENVTLANLGADGIAINEPHEGGAE